MVALQALSCCPLLLAAPGTPQAHDIIYRVGAQALHRIDPRLFGQFMERPSWGEIGPEGALIPGTHELQPEVLRLLREMRIPVLRFPGGTDVDFMDWRDMISNVPGRGTERPISIGHRGDQVTNNFGYDEFLRLRDDLGSDAIIVVNFRDGLLGKRPLAEAARHAAGLVAYCNAPLGAQLPEGMPDWPSVRARNGHAEPYGVRSWQIGNETWAFWKQLAEQTPQEPEKRYVDCVEAYAKAMLAVDPTIEFIVDADGATLEAGKLVRERLGAKVTHLVFHVYSPWSITEVRRDGEVVPADSLSDAEIWRAWVSTPGSFEDGLCVVRHPLLDEARRTGIRVAVTEWNWNGLWRVEPRPFGPAFAKGVGAAGFIHALMRSADVIDIACQSMLVGNSWGIHAIWADRNGEIAPHYMPTGQVTALYAQHHGPKLLALEATGVPSYAQPLQMGGIRPQTKVAYLDALATGDEAAVFLHVINRHFDQQMAITVDLTAQGAMSGKGRQFMLEGRLNDRPVQGEPRQIGRITERELSYDGKVLRVVLPPRTVSCIELPRRG
jgi:alpha-N-arabinofuranosidase